MAEPYKPNALSLVVELEPGITAAKTRKTSEALIAAFTPAKHLTILHYAWGVHLTPGPEGRQYMLLSTVYDEAFEPYIADLVHALPDAFNLAAEGIVGMKELIPIEKNLTQFTKFLLARDLTKGGKAYVGGRPGFFAGYNWTVNQIRAGVPASPPLAKR